MRKFVGILCGVLFLFLCLLMMDEPKPEDFVDFNPKPTWVSVFVTCSFFVLPLMSILLLEYKKETK